MTIKAFFDVSWQGPVLDAANKATGEVKGKIIPPPGSILLSPVLISVVPIECLDDTVDIG